MLVIARMLVARRPFDHSVDVVYIEDRGGDRYFAQKIEMTRVEPGMQVQPTMTIPETEAQHLLEELWRAGFRPTDFKDTTGEVAAMKAHLTDLQQLVFNPRGVHNTVLRPRGDNSESRPHPDSK